MHSEADDRSRTRHEISGVPTLLLVPTQVVQLASESECHPPGKKLGSGQRVGRRYADQLESQVTRLGANSGREAHLRKNVERWLG